MRNGLVVVALVLAGFAGGWFTHKETQSRCYVLPGYTDPAASNPYLPAGSRTNPPELVCK